MKKVCLLGLVVGLLCWSSVFAAEGGDGSTIETAVVIKYVGDYAASIDQEYQYISEKFGTQGVDWEFMGQSLLSEGERSYDQIDIELVPSKEQKTVYFDITEPFAVLSEQLGEE